MLVGRRVSGNRQRKGELIRYKCPDRDNQRVTTVNFVMVGRMLKSDCNICEPDV